MLSWNSVAFAQVYKSYDAQGNVVFSDKPTKRSSEVEISDTNLSDSFDVPPAVESPPETEPEEDEKPEPEPEVQPVADHDPADTNNDGRVSRREKEEQRKERRKLKREEKQAADGYQEFYSN